MTEAMPFLQKAILLSYAPRSFEPGFIANTLLFEYNTPFDAEKNGSGKFDIHKQDRYNTGRTN